MKSTNAVQVRLTNMKKPPPERIKAAALTNNDAKKVNSQSHNLIECITCQSGASDHWQADRERSRQGLKHILLLCVVRQR